MMSMQSVIEKERRGDFLGKTVQVHLADIIICLLVCQAFSSLGSL